MAAPIYSPNRTAMAYSHNPGTPPPFPIEYKSPADRPADCSCSPGYDTVRGMLYLKYMHRLCRHHGRLFNVSDA